MVHLAPVVRRLHRRSSRPMREPHPGTLAAKPRVRKPRPRPIKSSGAKSIRVGSGEGTHLGVGAQVLIRSERSALRLAMGGKAGLGERRTSAKSP